MLCFYVFAIYPTTVCCSIRRDQIILYFSRSFFSFFVSHISIKLKVRRRKKNMAKCFSFNLLNLELPDMHIAYCISLTSLLLSFKWYFCNVENGLAPFFLTLAYPFKLFFLLLFFLNYWSLLMSLNGCSARHIKSGLEKLIFLTTTVFDQHQFLRWVSTGAFLLRPVP